MVERRGAFGESLLVELGDSAVDDMMIEVRG